CKGICKSVTKKLTIDDYRSCVLNEIETLEDGTVIDHRIKKVEMHSIQSSKHIVTTNKTTKVALNAFSDKRYDREIVYNTDGSVKYARGVASYAYGHFRIEQEKGEIKKGRFIIESDDGNVKYVN